MESRDKILTDLFNNHEVNEVISKMHPVELQDELKAEVFLVLCELDENKLIDLHLKKNLKFYLVRIIINYVRSSDKKFYKKFRNFTEYVEVEKPDVKDEHIEGVMDCFESLYWYQKEIMRLYTFEFNCNAKELSRATGIPYMSLIRTLNQTKKELKKLIRK